jgi:VanZ family protein
MMSYDRAVRTVCAVTWTILVLLLMLRSDVRQPDGVPGIDKIGHFILYAVLAFFWYRWLRLHFNNVQSLAITIVTILLMGTCTELMQHFVPGRYVSAGDLLANWIGTGAGAGFMYWRRPAPPISI